MTSSQSDHERSHDLYKYLRWKISPILMFTGIVATPLHQFCSNSISRFAIEYVLAFEQKIFIN